MPRPDTLAMPTTGLPWADHLLRSPAQFASSILFPADLASTVRIRHKEFEGWAISAHLLPLRARSTVMACLLRLVAPDGWAGAFVCGTVNADGVTIIEEAADQSPALADAIGPFHTDAAYVEAADAARRRILPVLRAALSDPDGWAAGQPEITAGTVAGWAAVGVESALFLRQLNAVAAPANLTPMPVQFYEMALGGWIVDEIAIEWWHAEALGGWRRRHALGWGWRDIARLREAGWTTAGVQSLYREAGINLAAPSWMGTGDERLSEGRDQHWRADVALWEKTVGPAYATRCLDAGLGAMEVAQMQSAANPLPDEAALMMLAAMRGHATAG